MMTEAKIVVTQPPAKELGANRSGRDRRILPGAYRGSVALLTP